MVAVGGRLVRSVALTVCLGVLLAPAGAATRAPHQRLPSGFVHLREVDASIVQDIRYATPSNFTGSVVPGYAVGECILLEAAARALAQVQADLRPRDLGLKVYDCYRPARAVKAFVDWVGRGAGAELGPYWPRTTRGGLVAAGYISSDSNHSRGVAVDLTLVRLDAAAPAGTGSTTAPCNGPAEVRRHDGSLDMGTSFDCFDVMSATGSREITAEQRRNRQLLVSAMAGRGFRNYRREWWHFTYGGARGATKPEDVPVQGR
ncbi:M15 family metallopeptidase [Chelatococcus reniformis]|uniref:D-alanyl-D-alanine dipeptidase n=1 Tax=Chelatococcus reniformis TaxID=1494448 RepID=A0A916URT0_9HYPH|nr:M15 family metallopeptidase [Chelatococcus reniformis]GGC85195.1 D-alanyl-D-alanine dipeptidase [Chelatococcus reniformis]